MASISIMISEQAYKILKAQKREGESFSDVILRTFPRGHPARILASLQDREPLDEETAESIRTVTKDLKRNFKLKVQ
jgi:predicted CopG family antitoxin